jgi:hypothetical protein
MKIEITLSDVTRAAEGELDSATAKKFLATKKKEAMAAMIEAAQEALDDLVFDFSLDQDEDEDEDEEDDNDE